MGDEYSNLPSSSGGLRGLKTTPKKAQVLVMLRQSEAMCMVDLLSHGGLKKVPVTHPKLRCLITDGEAVYLQTHRYYLLKP